ncbi:hypothetical protein Anapl_03994 [Anas platyrhynchos]|uniref:Uncharacterized protein n=1 Tax=Anas platyrhynchos TaxID=8839 RepID=R0LLM4_ANAPL|nr:hypothetical protein Anapl_03994 [Anas platyrhynchos]
MGMKTSTAMLEPSPAIRMRADTVKIGCWLQGRYSDAVMLDGKCHLMGAQGCCSPAQHVAEQLLSDHFQIPQQQNCLSGAEQLHPGLFLQAKAAQTFVLNANHPRELAWSFSTLEKIPCSNSSLQQGFPPGSHSSPQLLNRSVLDLFLFPRGKNETVRRVSNPTRFAKKYFSTNTCLAQEFNTCQRSILVAFQHQETHLGGLGSSNKSISPLEAIMAAVGYTDWGVSFGYLAAPSSFAVESVVHLKKKHFFQRKTKIYAKLQMMSDKQVTAAFLTDAFPPALVQISRMDARTLFWQPWDISIGWALKWVLPAPSFEPGSQEQRVESEHFQDGNIAKYCRELSQGFYPAGTMHQCAEGMLSQVCTYSVEKHELARRVLAFS